MTTTLTLSKNITAKMVSPRGMKSLSIKIAGIFFILLLNLTSLSARTPKYTCKSSPRMSLYQVQTNKIPKNLKLYTVFLVKKFPTINVTIGNLSVKEENESPNLAALFSKTPNTISDHPINSVKNKPTPIATKLPSQL